MWIWRSHFFQWMKLLALSSAISFVLFWFHLPAALLLGPMIAGISLSLRGAEIRVPRPFFIAAQAIIGCMIARSLTPSIFGVLLANWALVLLILFSTLAISALAGWLLVRYSDLPGATGAWGSSPGGASAMVIMAQEYGADVRLVALIQYLRVLFVAGAAALVVRVALGGVAWAAAALSFRGDALPDADWRAGAGRRLAAARTSRMAAGAGLCRRRLERWSKV